MADNYGVQVSIKNDVGHMLNVRGISVQEVETHLTQIFGEEMAKSILSSFTLSQAVQNVQQGFGQDQVQQQPTQGQPQAPAYQPPVQPQAQPPAQSGPAPAPQGQAPGAAPYVGAAPAPQGQAPQGAAPQQPAPACGICGQPKKYTPPGFSQRTQKSYNGFYSCPNNRDDYHNQMKAQGHKE